MKEVRIYETTSKIVIRRGSDICKRTNNIGQKITIDKINQTLYIEERNRLTWTAYAKLTDTLTVNIPLHLKSEESRHTYKGHIKN